MLSQWVCYRSFFLLTLSLTWYLDRLFFRRIIIPMLRMWSYPSIMQELKPRLVCLHPKVIESDNNIWYSLTRPS